MADIYALCDRGLLERFGIGFEDFVAFAKHYDAKILQYRDKTASIEERQENIKRLRKLWDGILIINDEFALAAYCDGVHIGQEDLANIIESFGARSKMEGIAILRGLIGKKIIGLSTHNEAEIEEANLLDIDYVGLGAYRASSTKDVSNLLGERLGTIAARSRHNVAAIGGVCIYDPIPNVRFKAVGTDLVIKALSYA